jgi:hypothetical protein
LLACLIGCVYAFGSHAGWPPIYRGTVKAVMCGRDSHDGGDNSLEITCRGITLDDSEPAHRQGLTVKNPVDLGPADRRLLAIHAPITDVSLTLRATAEQARYLS